MTRIKMINSDDAKGEVELLFEAVTAMLGRVPNSWKVLAKVPHVSKLLLPLSEKLLFINHCKK